MKIGTENIDEVLFDYFEGNLSEVEKKEVKQFIDENPSYLEDFRLWEVSNAKQYITEPVSIDKGLLKNKFVFSVNKLVVLIASIICAGLIAIFALSDKDEKPIQSVSPQEIQKTVIKESMKQEVENKESASNVIIQRNRIEKERIKNTVIETRTEIIIPEQSVAENVETIKPMEGNKDLVFEREDSLTINSDNTIRVTKTELTRQEQRKAKREAEKFKQRAKDKRQQQEFMKGDKPYVVPLNPSNF